MRKSTHTAQYKSLCVRLRDIRRAAGLSQRELAGRLRTMHSWVAKVETGERRIDLLEFAWFCVACGAPTSAEASRLISDWQLDDQPKPAARTRRRR